MLAASLSLSGCLDFVDLTVAGGQVPARLQVLLHLVEDSMLCRGGCRLPGGTPVAPGPGGIVAWFDARLEAGADAGGVPRMIEDETLMLLGRSFEPVDRLPDGTRLYAGALALDTSLVERVRITMEPPELDAVGADIPPIDWFMPGREGPDTIVVAEGEDLMLRLAPPAEEPEPELQFGTWSLELAGDPPLRVSSTDIPPLDLRAPSFYLPDDSIFPVRLDMFLGATLAPLPADYVVALVVDVKLGWTVRRSP